jgi:hypothetical protein
VDLTKQFFFSTSYCLANTLQRNHDVHGGQDPNVYDSMFVWNSHLTRCGRREGLGRGLVAGALAGYLRGGQGLGCGLAWRAAL